MKDWDGLNHLGCYYSTVINVGHEREAKRSGQSTMKLFSLLLSGSMVPLFGGNKLTRL